jgi:phosphohistidine phosphatase SixA
MTAIVVRHGAAGDRDRFPGDDRLRPLTAKGRRQAEALAEALRGAGVSRILSSPAVRCLDTVAPLAAASGITVEPAEELAEGADPRAALALATGGEGVVVLCTHGDVCSGIAGGHTRKGQGWILALDATGAVTASAPLEVDA